MRRAAVEFRATVEWLADSQDVLANLLRNVGEGQHESSRGRMGGRSRHPSTVNDESRKPVRTKSSRT